MILRQKLCQSLNELLQPSLFSDYCINGLQVEGTEEIFKIATAVSATLETIEEVIQIGAQALIVHHGLFWTGDSFAITGVKKKKLALILQNQLNLIAYHLPLDAHQEVGNNWQAAREMGWTELTPFYQIKGAAIGVKGRVPKQSRKHFQSTLEQYYQHNAAAALGGKEEIETVGLISGGAYKSLVNAAQENLDCFVTGNYDEPAWSQAFEERVNFFALGHSATERIGPRALRDYLQDTLKLDTTFIDIPNPF